MRGPLGGVTCSVCSASWSKICPAKPNHKCTRAASRSNYNNSSSYIFLPYSSLGHKLRPAAPACVQKVPSLASTYSQSLPDSSLLSLSPAMIFLILSSDSRTSFISLSIYLSIYLSQSLSLSLYLSLSLVLPLSFSQSHFSFSIPLSDSLFRAHSRLDLFLVFLMLSFSFAFFLLSLSLSLSLLIGYLSSLLSLCKEVAENALGEFCPGENNGENTASKNPPGAKNS